VHQSCPSSIDLADVGGQGGVVATGGFGIVESLVGGEQQRRQLGRRVRVGRGADRRRETRDRVRFRAGDRVHGHFHPVDLLAYSVGDDNEVLSGRAGKQDGEFVTAVS